MTAIYNKENEQYEVFDTQVMDMVPTGARYVAEQPRYEKVDYLRSLDGNCGYCYQNPCECDGFGYEPIHIDCGDADRITSIPGYERPNYTPVERQNMHPQSERPTCPR